MALTYSRGKAIQELRFFEKDIIEVICSVSSEQFVFTVIKENLIAIVHKFVWLMYFERLRKRLQISWKGIVCIVCIVSWSIGKPPELCAPKMNMFRLSSSTTMKGIYHYGSTVTEGLVNDEAQAFAC